MPAKASTRTADVTTATDTPSGHKAAAAAKGGRGRGNPPRWWGMLCGFVGNHLSRVSPPAACCWMVLFRNSTNGRVCMSLDHIGLVMGVSGRYVQTLIKELIAADLLERLSRGNRNAGPNRYRMLSTGTTVPVEGEGSTGTTVPTATGTTVPTLQERTDATLDAERVGVASSDDSESDPKGGTGR